MRLVEPTLNNGNDKIFRGYCGTSFSAPHVTHIAARIERALEKQLHEKPSANLIRAILINSARCTEDMIEKGTLQQRIWKKKAGGGKDLLWDVNEPYIYILVTGKKSSSTQNKKCHRIMH